MPAASEQLTGLPSLYQIFEDAPAGRARDRGCERGMRVAVSANMRFAPSLLVASLFSLSGCPAASLGTAGAGGSGGVTGTGGAAGAGATSPGTVTLQVTLPPGRSYCDENASCGSTQHLAVETSSGLPLALGTIGCAVPCSTCAAVPCVEPQFVNCPAGSFGVAVTGSSLTWDGSYAEPGGCEPNGSSASISCLTATFAAAGTYVARYCATPGTLATTDGGAPYCTATGPEECVEVPFTFPSSQPITITLPTD
jgi:hypothetical protein